MAAKRIQVSDDAGVTWFTLPGSSGDRRRELATVTDTVFGQSFESNMSTLGQWMITGNAYFKGVVGYIANLKMQGTSTAMTAEAMSLVSGKTYKVTDGTKSLIDYFSNVTILDNAVDKTVQVESIDYLNGTVTFLAGYTPTGPITITGNYIPLVAIAKGKSFTLTQTAAEIDTTDYETARSNGGWRTFDRGLRTVSLEIGGIYDVTNDAQTILGARAAIVIDISPDNTDDTFFRGYFMMQNTAEAGDVGALETETLNFGLWVPDGDLLAEPFSWTFTTDTKLNQAVRKVINAWLGDGHINVKYLPDGGTTADAGSTGDAIVTECSLANTLEGQNEFSCSFRGSGTPTDV